MSVHYYHRILRRVLQTGHNQPIIIGKISKKKRKLLNNIRSSLGQPLFRDRSVYLYPRVIQKLQRKHMLLDGVTKDELAVILLSTLFNKRTRIFPSRYVHIQILVRLRRPLIGLLFLGITAESRVVLKTVYQRKYKELKKTLGGGTFPPSNSAGSLQ